MIEIFENIGLTEAITFPHCATYMVPTQQRESHPIYSIYTSITLQVSDGGYLPFGIIPLDHCPWIKIDLDYAFDAKMDTLVPHTACRLKCQKNRHHNTLYRITQ